MEKHRFAHLWSDEATPLVLTSSELALFLEGSALVGRTPLSPPALDRQRDLHTHASLFRDS